MAAEALAGFYPLAEALICAMTQSQEERLIMTWQVQETGTTRTPFPSNKGGKRKRLRIVAIVLLALSVWAGTKAWGQMERISERAEQMANLDKRLSDTQQLNDSLKREIERLNDPEYREEMMRRDMHLSKDGETVFDIPRVNP